MGAGLTESGIERLRGVARRYVLDDSIPGPSVPGLVVAVLRGDQSYVEALGTLALGGGPPVRRDSIFRIASVTKPIVAAAALILVDEGLLGLDDPVDELLPELADRRVLRRPDGPLDDTVPARRPITTRDLLTYTFGFGIAMEMFSSARPWPVVEATTALRLATIGPPDPAVQPDTDAWIAGLGSLPLITQPGERWLYNTSASVLGVLLARAAKAPLGEVLRTRLFDPLGMRDTDFWTPHIERLATGYLPSPQGLEVWDSPGGAWSRPPAFADGAGGLVSTADDLLAFTRMLMDGGAGVLPAEAVRAMTSDQLTAGQKAHGGLTPDAFAGASWGFGLAVRDGGGYGWDGGFGTSWLVDPARDLAVIVLTQRQFEGPVLPAVHQDIQDAAYAAVS